MRSKPRRLRWRLASALIATTVLLWLGFALLVYNSRMGELEDAVDNTFQRTKSGLQMDALSAYQENRANGLGERADHILMSHLSSLTLDGIRDMDGGTALAVRLGEAMVRSQITWGLGYEADDDQEWYLYFDQGLDDEGQMDFARWMIDHRSGWAYAIYPFEEERESDSTGDGTFARITGVERPGGAVEVQTLDLIHPDGSQERILKTDAEEAAVITLDLVQIEVRSVLLPSRSGDGQNGPIQMERRLAGFREAQAIIDRNLAGERRAVLKEWGRLSSRVDQEGFGYWCSAYCDLGRNVLEDQWALYLTAFGFAAMVLLILSAHLSKKVTEPVEELSQTVRNGSCREDGPVTELNALAAAFNDAQAQLSGQLERERAFTRAAAHELKTPLAILRTHAEALKEDIAPEKREQYLDVVLDETDRMAELVGRLLELSRLESGAALNRETVDLAALVRKVWAPLSLQLEQKEITLALKLEEIQIEGDRARLKEAIENLASNALRHCDTGKAIRVSLERKGGEACLSVYNDGPAIPAEDLPHLFEPFYRGDKSRGRDSGGTGLGLAIVRAAVLAHGGDCSVESRQGGVCFQILLPLEDDTAPGA